ncbi:GerMN domain-containing protein [Leptolyngbya sp. AN03gr2]|uniref:GerMN domain-containing protein n=1 Tax=unclassified Leptolyngbya TaxID=2650499 RepID=UPI003D31B056
MKLQIPRSAHPDVIAGLSLLLTLTGGVSWIIWQTSNPHLSTQPSTIAQPEKLDRVTPKTAPQPAVKAPAAPTLQQAPAQETPVTQPTFEPPAYVYWLQASGQQIEMVPVAIARTPHRTETAALTEALTYLFTHPQVDRLNSTIPEGTKLLSLQHKPDGIHIDLSQAFTQGGGTTSMTYRVAQVLYTATSLDPQAKVYLSVEGQLLSEDNPLGGEGLILQQPLTRQQFVEDLLSQE